jgi:hypothetical protein
LEHVGERSGHASANGATYPFTASLTLYAQWKKGKVAFHEVRFFACVFRCNSHSDSVSIRTVIPEFSHTSNEVPLALA